MAVVLKLTFPAGRYHATPWGRHVNEGVPEWPPSPWRLLRSLVSVWRRTCPDVTEAQMKRILTAINQPPLFMLPPHRVAHTRHAMPMNLIACRYRPSDAERKAGKFQGDPSIVFDTFVTLGRSEPPTPLFIGWPDAELSPDDLAVLGQLLRNLSFLGRAESWVQAELSDESPDWNCCPVGEAELDPVRVLCADPATAFDGEHYPSLDPKKLAKGKVPLADFLFDCPRWHLCLDTETLHERRWPAMPGSRWVAYRRPSEAAATRYGYRPSTRPKPIVARLLLDGPVLPLAIDTIRVAEAIRRAAMSQFGNWCRRNEDRAGEYRRQDSPGQFASPVLSGKDDAGTILCAHRHAHYLPTCETPDRHRLTHVTIFARDGLSDGEVAALSSIRDVNMGGDISLRVQLTGVGDLSQFGGPIFQTASEWYSLTPFLGPAHIGRNRQERYLRKALRKEWRRLAEQIDEFRDVQLEEVTPLAIDDPSWISRPRPYEFRRSRTKHLGEKYRPVGIFRLRFSRPIPGPLTLGYASHFGLGLFEAAGDAHGDTTEGGV